MARKRDLSLAFAETHPGDAARVLEQLASAEAAAFLKLVPVRIGAPVLQRMLPTSAAQCLEQLDDESAAGLVRDIDAQAGSAALRYVSAPRRERLIAQLPTSTALAFRLLLAYPEDMVGAWINPHALALTPETPVSEALERLRQAPETAGSYLYVVDADRHLLGIALLTDLLRAGRGATVAQIKNPVRHRLSARVSLAAAREHPGWQEYHALPVLERDERFVGALEYPLLHRATTPPRPDTSAPATVDTLSLLAGAAWLVYASLLQSLLTLLPAARPLSEAKRDEP